MPLLYIKQINNESSWALWKIDESLEDLLNLLEPDEEDLLFLSTVSSEKRKLEWLAGRLTVKKLAGHKNVNYDVIRKDEFGKPCLKGAKAEVSISHSFPYAAAIIHQSRPVGIDIEHLRPKLVKMAERFLSDQEITSAQADLHKLCLYWSAKEVLYKIYHQKRLIYKKDLEILPFETELEGFLKGYIYLKENTLQIDMKYTKVEDIMVVFSI